MSSQTRRRFVLISQEEIVRHVEAPDTPRKSLIKLIVSFIYCLLALWITAFVMIIVHERLPDMKKYPPLPDLILDSLPFVPGAFEMCEIIGMFMTAILITVLFFHSYRVVILRRMFSLIGSVYLLRCVTMLLTSLSVPGVHLECEAKDFGPLKNKLWEAFNIWAHAGMSIQGVRTCGDYMFSGHTSAVTLVGLFIREYTPESWTGLHTITWILNCFAIFFILAAKEHYSIDVFVAFYISTRLFLYYHQFAYHHKSLKDWRSKYWFPLGWFFESGSIGQVPNQFEIPFLFESDTNQPTTIESKTIHAEVDEIVTEGDEEEEETKKSL